MTEITPDRAELLTAFRQAMLDKLNLESNVAKGDWRELPIPTLIRLLKRELGELQFEVDRRRVDLIANEAVDVANFAFMIWDLAERSLAGPSRSAWPPK